MNGWLKDTFLISHENACFETDNITINYSILQNVDARVNTNNKKFIDVVFDVQKSIENETFKITESTSMTLLVDCLAFVFEFVDNQGNQICISDANDFKFKTNRFRRNLETFKLKIIEFQSKFITNNECDLMFTERTQIHWISNLEREQQHEYEYELEYVILNLRNFQTSHSIYVKKINKIRFEVFS